MMLPTAAAICGPKRVERALACTRKLIDLFAGSGLKEGHHVEFDSSRIVVDGATRTLFLARDDEAGDSHPEAMLKAVREQERNADGGAPQG